MNRALEGMGVAHAYIETRGDRFAVAIPVSDPIQTSSAYTRIAALIEQDIGVSGATKGSAICTFVFKPVRRANIEVITGVILNAENYRLSANAAGRKAFAKNYEGTKSSILKSMPPLRPCTPHLRPPRATWDGNDLFSF